VLRRSIDLGQDDLTVEEKVFRGAKRICAIFAISAVTLSALDLANIRTAESAAEFIHDSRIRLGDISFGDLPQRIRFELDRIALADTSSVTVAIPREDIAIASRSMSIVAKSGGSPVAALADLRQEDAIELAMATPRAMSKSEGRVEHEPAMRKPLQLASVDPISLPDTTSAIPPAINISLPSMIDVLPPPAPGVPPPSPAQRLKLNEKEYARAEKCLANAIYFESRSEPERGQEAVAQVIMNRVFSGFYPNDVCSVVYQNAERHLSCQFTFACDGKRKNITERGAWARANRIAKATLDGKIYVPEVAKSTHYHAIYVHPNWVGEMKKMVRYGIHNFYRPIAWGAGAELPTWGIGPWNKKKTN